MKYEDYIKKLGSSDDDIEKGMLLELYEKPPADFHEQIMNSINRERRRFNLFNYRVYVPAVAALLLIAVAINRPEVFRKIKHTDVNRIAQEQAIGNEYQKENNSEDINREAVSDDTVSSEENSKIQESYGTSSENKEINTSSEENNKVAESNPPPKNTIVASNEDINNEDINNEDNAPSEEDMVDSDVNEEYQLNFSDYIGMLFFNEPKINYEIVLDTNKATVLNFITENNEEKISGSNTYKLSLEQFERLDKLLNKNKITKETINEPETTSRVVKISFVNYHILIDKSAPDIVKFIEDQGKSIKISDDIYKISNEDMSILNKLLASSGIKKELVNEVNDKYSIIKTSIVNYEVNIDANRTEVNDFLNNTTKVTNNIYKMSKDDFIKFKDLLSNINGEIKFLNESSSQNILISINKI